MTVEQILQKEIEESKVQISELMDSRLNEIILKINQEHDIFEADKLHSELRILDWILYHFVVTK